MCALSLPTQASRNGGTTTVISYLSLKYLVEIQISKDTRKEQKNEAQQFMCLLVIMKIVELQTTWNIC